LPDIGEGVAEGEILKWFVKEGENVKEDQPLVEVMTDKVNVQIPSPRSGLVSRVLAKEGETVKVGQTILVITEDGEKKPGTPSSPVPRQTASLQPQAPMANLSESGMTTTSSSARVLATPATRRLARELKIDISTLKGGGPQGRVTDEDVRSAARRGAQGVTTRMVPVTATSAVVTQPSKKEQAIPLRGIRRTIAERMVKSRDTAAHVTHVDEADVTELVLIREALKGSAEKRGVKLTYLPLIVKALIPALKEFPYLNSSLDEQSGNIILKGYYNFGIAVDTERGLVVSVVKDADTKDIFTLAGEIEKLAEKARAGQLSLEEVHGSTFTITNVGAIGGLFATPIINLPDVAILGVYKIVKRPVFREGKVDVRDMMYISLTFDHRVVDGAYAARFTTRVIETIQDPKKLLAELL
ncbi:MAG TPA: dihydrolipoamide acetyltransferase family protein, partial [Nitrososphaerales archaeon]|nr:dihydrolipoamide acetyltransferase family protein [Nitrososphaerales archaeon]